MHLSLADRKVNFSELQPHQVVNPCFGGRDTWASKVGLCRILRDIDPDLCYVLPEDQDRFAGHMDGRLFISKLAVNPDLPSKFNSKGGAWAPEGFEDTWFNEGRYHTGNSVTMVTRADQLPRIDVSTHLGVVQPALVPYLGEGCMARKWELHLYVAMISSKGGTPLRFYAYDDMEVILARKLYDTAASGSDIACVQDTHWETVQGNCTDTCVVNTPGWPPDGRFSKAANTHRGGRTMSFANYSALVQMPPDTKTKLVRDIHDLVSRIPGSRHHSAGGILTRIHIRYVRYPTR